MEDRKRRGRDVLPYTLIRAERKTVALIVDREGRLIVRAPRKASVRSIEAFIQEKLAE